MGEVECIIPDDIHPTHAQRTQLPGNARNVEMYQNIQNKRLDGSLARRKKNIIAQLRDMGVLLPAKGMREAQCIMVIELDLYLTHAHGQEHHPVPSNHALATKERFLVQSVQVQTTKA
jgi:hypothetical protein